MNKQINKYKIIREIGRGAYATVYEAFDEQKNMKVALKQIDNKASKDMINNEYAILKIIRDNHELAKKANQSNQYNPSNNNQIDNQQMLNNYNHILELVDECFIIDDYSYIVMKYYEDSMTFTHYLDQYHSQLTERSLLQYYYQLVCGLKLLHSLKIFHRDLKLDNFLYCPNEDRLVIIDFGFAVSKKKEANEQCGSKMYSSPQVVLSLSSYSPEKNDIWSMGIILFYLMHKRFPICDINSGYQAFLKAMNDYFQNNKNYEIDPNCSIIVKNMLTKMLVRHENNRTNIDELYTLLYNYLYSDKNVQILNGLNKLVINSNNNIQNINNNMNSLQNKFSVLDILKSQTFDDVKKVQISQSVSENTIKGIQQQQQKQQNTLNPQNNIYQSEQMKNPKNSILPPSSLINNNLNQNNQYPIQSQAQQYQQFMSQQQQFNQQQFQPWNNTSQQSFQNNQQYSQQQFQQQSFQSQQQPFQQQPQQPDYQQQFSQQSNQSQTLNPLSMILNTQQQQSQMNTMNNNMNTINSQVTILKPSTTLIGDPNRTTIDKQGNNILNSNIQKQYDFLHYSNNNNNNKFNMNNNNNQYRQNLSTLEQYQSQLFDQKYQGQNESQYSINQSNFQYYYQPRQSQFKEPNSYNKTMGETIGKFREYIQRIGELLQLLQNNNKAYIAIKQLLFIQFYLSKVMHFFLQSIYEHNLYQRYSKDFFYNNTSNFLIKNMIQSYSQSNKDEIKITDDSAINYCKFLKNLISNTILSLQNYIMNIKPIQLDTSIIISSEKPINNNNNNSNINFSESSIQMSKCLNQSTVIQKQNKFISRYQQHCDPDFEMANHSQFLKFLNQFNQILDLVQKKRVLEEFKMQLELDNIIQDIQLRLSYLIQQPFKFEDFILPRDI